MDKISGIIPTSARVSNVDMKDAMPVRPGVPSFGRPVGVSNLAKNVTKSGLDTLLERPMTDRQLAEMERAQIVERVSSGFFMKEPVETAYTPATQVDIQNRIQENSKYFGPEVDQQFQIEEPGAPANDLAMADSSGAEEPEFIRPGSYIDVEV